MHKTAHVLSVFSFLVLLVSPAALAQQEEKFTITTYYPSPAGVYNQLQAKRVVIGDVNADGQLNSADVPATARPLFVQGSTTAITTAGFGNTAGYGVGIGSADGFTVGTIQSHFYQNGVSSGPAPNLAINFGGGNVGIGTVTPSSKLEVAAPSGTTAIRVVGGAAGTSNIVTISNEIPNEGILRLYNDDALGVNITATGNSYFGYGNLGLGTNQPLSKLHFANNVATLPIDNFAEYQQLLYSSGAPATSYGLGISSFTLWMNSNRDFRFIRQGTNTDMIITNGNVGIGTVAPSETLDVNGNIRVVGKISTGCHLKACSPGISNNAYCSCDDGETLHSGGCAASAQGTMKIDMPHNLTTWRCNAVDPATTVTINIICCRQD